MQHLLLTILTALLLTIGVELVVALVMGCRTRHDLTAVVLVNLVTHPPFSVLFLVGRGFCPSRATGLGFLLVLEVLVTLAEWQLLRRVLTPQAPSAGRLAVFMNLISGSLGVIRSW